MTGISRTGSSRSRILTLGVAFAMLCGLGLSDAVTSSEAIPPGGPVTRPNGAKIKLSKKRVKAGTVIRVSGSNWKSRTSRVFNGRVVTVKLDDLHILGTFKINKKNRFSGTIRIPKRVKPGRHWLRFLAARPATSVKSPRFVVFR